MRLIVNENKTPSNRPHQIKRLLSGSRDAWILNRGNITDWKRVEWMVSLVSE